MKSFISRAIPMALFTAALGASSAFGATISQTCTISPTQVPFNTNPGPPTACLLNLFDSSIGTLTGVTLQITNVNGTVQPQQTNIAAGTLSFANSTATVGLTFTGPDGTSVSASQGSSACAGTVAGNSTNTTCTSTVFSGLNGPVVAAGVLASYQGVGPATFNVNATGDLINANGNGVGGGTAGKLFFGGDGTIGGTVNLVYDYNPNQTGSVPEPATSALIGSGLLGLVALARRRSRRS